MKYGRWNACLAASALLSGAVAIPIAAHAQSETRHDIHIAPGTLTRALQALSKQTGIAVGGTEPALSRLRTTGVDGRMTVADALRRLLNGTGYQAQRVSANVYRIERQPARAAAPATTANPLPKAAPKPIVVSASKSGTDLSDYPGAVQIVSANDLSTSAGPPLLENLLAAFPQTAGTALGAGRDKIFVRGIADSSFNGPTQSTVSLYLGEQRLIYSAPNPGLGLYDMDKIELIEGPQGTLYGAGALGGVIRLSPKAPDPSTWQGRIWSGAAITLHGEPGVDGAGMINAPLSDNTAVRLVAYGGREGGYVDDSERGLTNVNRSRTAGFRAALHSDLPEGWTVSASAFGQRRRTRDGQYIDPRFAGLTRESLIAQPFANDLIGGNLTLLGHLGPMRLVSATGIVDNDLDTRFDSSVLAGEGLRQAYDEARRIRLITHETRLSSPGSGALSWVAGVSFLSNRDDYTQLVTSLSGDSPPPFADIRYRIREYALFGEGTLRPAPRWSLTLGGRLVATESHSVRLFGANVAEDSDNPPLRFLPMAAIGWHPEPGTLVYARYQHGYRTGGVTVERADDGTPIPTQFRADKMQSAELGMRTRLSEPFDANLSLAAFYVRWRRIQGDLVQAEGFPITRNLGNGRIFGLTASARVRFDPVWHVEIAAFLNHNRIDRLTPSQTINRRTLPNVADFGAHASLDADVPLPSGQSLNLSASLRYVGTSYLDIDPTSQVRQGDYIDTALSASMTVGAWTLSFALDNVLDTRGNRFAFGNPFAVRLAPQATPLRPRTLRLSASMGF